MSANYGPGRVRGLLDAATLVRFSLRHCRSEAEFADWLRKQIVGQA
jgi:hypothetical protein